jgi:TonB-dependent receptor
LWKIGVAIVMLAAAAPAQAASGTVGGTIAGPDGGPLPGASVSVVGTRVETTTDRLGRYSLAPVPAGEQQLLVRYLGFADQTVTLSVGDGASVAQDVTMHLEAFMGTVTVSGNPILEGQAKALSEQKNAPNIVNVVSSDQIATFPDTNAAEATQRVPGVFIQRDQGEGRYVLIRGTEARLNSTQIDGERVPSPEGDVRQVAIDVVPADTLGGIQVSKALTPDQDADAIGGIVNLKLKDAPGETMLQASAGGYYGDLRDGDGVQADFTWGQRLVEGDVGLLLAGSYTDITRNTENFEASWGDEQPEEYETRDYNVNRERAGFVGAFDVHTSPGSVFRIKGTFNEFDDQEYRRRVVYKVEDGEIERELKDRFESQQIWNLYGEGEHVSESGSLLSYKLSYAHSEEEEPKANYPIFVQEDVEFEPAFEGGWFQPNPLNEELGEFVLDEIERNDNITEEDAVVVRVDYSLPMAGGVWKLGGKYRDNEKSRDQEVTILDTDDDVLLIDNTDAGYHAGSILDGDYLMGEHVDPSAVGRFLSLPGELEKDYEEDAADYEANEAIYAAYAMTELYLTDSIMLLPGVRYEYSDVDYTGYEVLFNEDGDYVSTNPVTGSNSYGEFFPSVQTRWAIDEQSNLRAAVTRSLARPNYVDLVPTRLIVEEDSEIILGNPALDPTTSWNLDLMYERFFATVGVVSAGAFYKSLDDYIYFFTSEEDYQGNEFEVTQPRNGEAATVWGLELAYQNQFRRAPAPFDGFGLFLNHTWTDSEATYPDRDDTTTLPGQAESVGNLALSYEKGFFSGILSYNKSGKYISEVGGDPKDDIYYDDHEQLDLQTQFRLTSAWALYLQLYNLTDEPLRYYVGSSDRPVQEEYYSWWALLGVRFRL